MAKKRFKANTEVLPNNYDDFFNKVYQNSDKYKDLSDNVFDKTETRRLDFDSHNQDKLTGSENPFTSQFGNPNAEDPYNELRASNQTFLPTVGAGLGRVVSKVVREVAKTVGALGGLGVALAENTSDLITGEDNHDFLQTTFDNAFIKGTDKLFDNANEALLPVYVSKAVRDGGFFDKVTSSEFWATEGADGVGYMISAFAPGAALKAFGASEKLFGAAAKLTSLRYGKSLEVARRGLAMAGVTANKIDSFVIPAANTFFEAGAESKGVGDDIEQRKPEAKIEFFKNLDVSSKEFQNKVLQKGHQLDLDRRSNKISIDEYNQLSSNLTNTVAEELFETNFKEQKSYAMRNTFLTNLAILAVPNYIQAKLLFGQNESKNLLKQLIQKPSKEGLKKAGTRVLESFASEGSEEVAQTSTEHRQTNKAIASKLHGGLDALKDISPGEFSKDFIKTLGTTEGQVAGFLGGFLGSGVSVVTGYKQDIKDATENKRLLDKIKNAGTSLNDINLNSFEKEVVKNEKGEDIEIFKKDEKGNKILNVENVQKIKKALDYHEELSQIYDNAVEEGDVETIQKVKKLAEHDLIMNFVSENEITIDALKEHLKEILPSEVEDKTKSKENQNRQNQIIEKAKYLQKELVSFQNMSTSIIKLENKNSTPEQVKSFMGNLQNEFLKETSLLYELRKEKQELIKDKAKLESETTLEEIDNSHFNEDLSHEFDKKVIGRIENPRLKTVVDKLTDLNKNIKDKESFLNYGVWNTKIVNGAFNWQINESNRIKESTSEEKVQKAEEVINLLNEKLSETDEFGNNTTTQEEYKTLLNNESLPEEIKAAIVEVQKEKVEQLPTQDEKETKRDLNRTEQEGVSEKDISEDDFIHKEEDEDVANSFTNSKEIIESEPENNPIGHKIQSKITEALEKIYKIFEKTPRDKREDKVTFSLGDLKYITGQPTLLDIFTNVKNGKKLITSEIEFLKQHQDWLENYLPIQVTLESKDKKHTVSTFLKANDKSSNFKSLDLPLRKAIIKALIENKGDFTKIEGSVQGQGKGKLNLNREKDDNGNTIQNNVLDISVLKGMKKPELLKYLRKNTYIVNHDKQLVKVGQDQPSFGFNDVIKSRHSGDVFLVFTRPNGEKVPIKLNNKRIVQEKAEATVKLLALISKVIKTGQSNNVLEEKDFNKLIKDNIGEKSYNQLLPEIKFSERNNNGERLKTILNYIVFSGNNNDISKLRFDEQGNLTVGRLLQRVNEDLQGENNEFDKGLTTIGFTGFAGQNIDAFLKETLEDENEQARFNHLVRFIMYKKTNIIANEFENDTYIEHVFGIGKNKEALVSTNVSVDQDIFGGYSDIFLNNEVTTLEDNKEKAKELKEIENTEIPLVKEVVYNEPTTSNQYEVEAKRVETESKIKRKDLFSDGGVFANELGGSGVNSVPTNHSERNGIEFVQFSNPNTGVVDVIMTGKSDNDFVGYYRIYENGKATNKWSSKFENQSRNKEDFKTMISGVQEMLPQGHEYTEKTSISTDGLRVWNQQLSRGYELQHDNKGNLITNRVAINGDAINNELGIAVNKGNFENISVTNNTDMKKVKEALLPYLQKFGLNENNIHFENGTVEIDLPVLKNNKAETTSTTSNQSDTEAKIADIERRRQEELKERAFNIEATRTEYLLEEGRTLRVSTYEDGSYKIFSLKGSEIPVRMAEGKNSNELTGEYFEDVYGENFPKGVVKPIRTGQKDKINAKYDAELKALENKLESNIDRINSKVEEIVNRDEKVKEFKPITKEDRKNVINFDDLFNKIGKTMNGEISNDKKESHSLLKSLLKEVHPDKFQNENQKLIAEIFTSAMIIVSKKGDKFKIQELYDLAKVELNKNNSENNRIIENNFVSLSNLDKVENIKDKKALIQFAKEQRDFKIAEGNEFSIKKQFEQLKQELSNDKDLNEKVKEICGL